MIYLPAEDQGEVCHCGSREHVHCMDMDPHLTTEEDAERHLPTYQAAGSTDWITL